MTVAAARIVMQDWGVTLELAMMELALFSGYVDDVRQGGTSIRLGLRYDTNTKSWRWSEGDYKEDMDMRRDGESRNERMIRLCLPVANSINRDLVFTAEKSEDFSENKLPTLDFVLWQMPDGQVNHDYFQKAMKTPYVIMKRSAISQHQKISMNW